LKNIFGQVDGEIENYRTTLIRLRDDFLALAAVTTEVAVLWMQHDVSKMQGDVSNVQDGVSKIQVDVSNITPAKFEAFNSLNVSTANGDVKPNIRGRYETLVLITSSDRRSDKAPQNWV
jgi:hypothetical protein